ncbi:MAG TPA: lysylphosphatidylglycerol synthase domain-containing protein [Solirubrobacteraceae bacterium]
MDGAEHLVGEAGAWLVGVGAKVGAADWRLLLLGAGLHVLGQLARARGWLGILRCTTADAHSLPARPALGSWMAGTGVGGLLPARLGDGVKLWLVRRHLPGASYLTLAGSLVAESAFYGVVSGIVIVWALTSGLTHLKLSLSATPLLAVAGVVALGLALALTVGRQRTKRAARRLFEGFAVMGSPRTYARRVAGWQVLSRIFEVMSLACLLGAFGLPATLVAALLALTAQGGGRLVPLLPVSAGVSAVWLSYGLSHLGAGSISIAHVAAFTVGVTVVETLVGLGVGGAVLAREGLPLGPRRLVRLVRAGQLAPVGPVEIAPSA